MIPFFRRFSVYCSLSLLLFVGVHQCVAQGYKEGFNLSFELTPLKESVLGIYDRCTEQNERMSCALPVYTDSTHNNYWLFGGTLERIGLTGSFLDLPFTDLYSIAPLAGYNKQLNSKFSAAVMLIPLLNTDLKSVTFSDAHFGAVIRTNYKVNDLFTFRFTLGYRQQFYGTQYILFAGLDWKISAKLRLFGDLPNNATLVYSQNKRMNVGISYVSGGYTSYGLTTQSLYILYNYAQPGLFAEYYITHNLAFRAMLAYSILRNIDVHFNGDKEIGVLDYIPLSSPSPASNGEFANGPSFKLSLSMRVPDK